MSMCLGDDSPYPELVHAPRPRRRHNLSEDEDAASPPSPRRPHRTSHFAPTVSEAMAGDEGGGRRSEEKVVAGEEIGFYGATKDLRQVCVCMCICRPRCGSVPVWTVRYSGIRERGGREGKGPLC